MVIARDWAGGARASAAQRGGSGTERTKVGSRCEADRRRRVYLLFCGWLYPLVRDRGAARLTYPPSQPARDLPAVKIVTQGQPSAGAWAAHRRCMQVAEVKLLARCKPQLAARRQGCRPNSGET